MLKIFNLISKCKSKLKNLLLKFKNFLADQEESKFWAVVYAVVVSGILTSWYFIRMIAKNIK